MYAAQKIAEALERGDERAAAYWQRIKDLVDQAPPLSPEQRDRLRVLLQPNSPVKHEPALAIAAPGGS